MFDSALDNLTPRQAEVFDAVRRHLDQHGYPPTVREIGTRLGLTSTSTVHAHLSALERAGLLKRDPSKPRAITLAGQDDPADAPPPLELARTSPDDSLELPLVGSVAAGAPILAEEHVEEYVPVPAMLARRGDSFLLRIQGDSMIDAGILDGDYVVVQRSQDARDGEIVIALVDGEPEATCKTLGHSADGAVELLPANASMSPICPETCEIVGIVTGVFRAI